MCVWSWCQHPGWRSADDPRVVSLPLLCFCSRRGLGVVHSFAFVQGEGWGWCIPRVETPMRLAEQAHLAPSGGTFGFASNVLQLDMLQFISAQRPSDAMPAGMLRVGFRWLKTTVSVACRQSSYGRGKYTRRETVKSGFSPLSEQNLTRSVFSPPPYEGGVGGWLSSAKGGGWDS